MQTSLFENENLNLPDADISFYQNFISYPQTSIIATLLEKEIAWKQDHLKFYGKNVPLPRLTAWYGDKGYAYSGIVERVNEWTPFLSRLKSKVEEKANAEFNGVLLNYYRDGQDSISWHSDDEKELGDNPTIASLSFGESRVFHLRHKIKDIKTSVMLTDGSLLIMAGETQTYWQHAVHKVKSARPRINLTFRKII